MNAYNYVWCGGVGGAVGGVGPSKVFKTERMTNTRLDLVCGPSTPSVPTVGTDTSSVVIVRYAIEFSCLQNVFRNQSDSISTPLFGGLYRGARKNKKVKEDGME
ncbi:hypothetical protein Q1695_000757 [Nippostrongylus brasiliensis]|nr:hypothetical protein Q1695_000757 [Nippostrongylus brasiliensis]